jgi:uncharacterized protein (DUF983 family)
MLRTCPNCSSASISTTDLLVGSVRCPACATRIGMNRFVSFLFSVLIVAVTVTTSYMVLSLYGIYAVIVWFVFPVGAIGYLRARFSPLRVLTDK